MSSSSAHYSSGDASYSSSSSYSNTLLHRNNIKEHEETLSNPKDIFLQPEDALPNLADNLPHSADALPYTTDALQHLVDAPSSPLHENTQSYMPPQNRSAGRDVHIFDTRDRSTSIGGLVLTEGVTNTNFYTMIEIFVLFNSEYVLRNESDVEIKKDTSSLLPGNYYIDSRAPFDINNEAALVRTSTSSQTGQRVQAFCNAVRSRDRRCVITGKEALGAPYDIWRGFDAAHIFPLAYEEHWKTNNFARWISIHPTPGGSINSVQNGMLLCGNIHSLFDAFAFSIDPDDGYKIVHFGFDSEEIAGKRLDRRLLDDPQKPVDELFRWHFRQAVLINMRGAGEPIFEHDFPPGSDIVGSILEGPKAAERMEFELFNRFAAEGLIE